MPSIYGVLSEEYCRLSKELQDYKCKLGNTDITPEQRDKIFKSIESIKAEIIFIEKAFNANNVSLPKGQTPIGQSREDWTDRIRKTESQMDKNECAKWKVGVFTNE